MTLLLLLSLQLVGFVLLAYLLLMVARQVRQPAPPSALTGLQPGVEELIAELRRTADQINRDLAVRSAALQRLLSESERRLHALEQAIEKAQSAASLAAARAEPAAGPGLQTAPGHAGPASGVSREAAPARLLVQRLARQGLPVHEIARQTRLGREEVELLLGLNRERQVS